MSEEQDKQEQEQQEQVEGSSQPSTPTEPTEPTEAPKDAGTQPTEPTAPTQEEPPKKEDEIQDTLQKSGFDYAALEQEYRENGDLTEETREKLNKIGFTNEFINDFINGRKALYEQEVNELASTIGGREEYDKVIDWAGKNLPAEIVQSINEIRDKNILKEFILPKLKESMDDAEGVPPQITIKGNGGKSGVDIFESQEQMFAAIRDPRYKSDPAYAAKVTAKVRASREAGIDLGI